MSQILVIGGGPGGYIAAIRASQFGNKVTVIEKEALGGTCLNYGCIPSKIFKSSSELFEKINHFDDFGIELNDSPKFNMNKLQIKKKKIIDIQKKGIESLLKHSNIEIVSGTAKISGKNSVTVKTHEGEEKEIYFDKLIIAAGTKTRELKGFEFDHENILSSDDLLDLNYIPESIAIVGGGIIGCEFGSILSSLGSKVFIIEAEERLLPVKNLHKDVSKNLEREFKKKKIKVFTKSFAKIKSKENQGFVIETIPADEKTKANEIICQKIAVCTGRVPLSSELGLENAGIKTDESGYIIVDENYETSCKNIYAIGDILGPDFSMLAHTAYFEGRICAEKISGSSFTKLDYSKIPSAVFTSPEIGFIGETEETAKEKGFETVTEKVLFRTSGKAHAMGEISGEAIIVADKNTKKILGVHIIGPNASDLCGESALMVQNNLSCEDLANSVHAHPTLSEVIMETGLKLSGINLHG
jgi:dihydrolipoamide dehydrogenase